MVYKSKIEYTLNQQDIIDLIAERCGVPDKHVHISVMHSLNNPADHEISAEVIMSQEGIMDAKTGETKWEATY